jgi:hypothetical protein
LARYLDRPVITVFRDAAKADKDVAEQAANRCVDPSWQVL